MQSSGVDGEGVKEYVKGACLVRLKLRRPATCAGSRARGGRKGSEDGEEEEEEEEEGWGEGFDASAGQEPRAGGAGAR